MRVGVILQNILAIAVQCGIPHASGGDPQDFLVTAENYDVFPMRVGVIPHSKNRRPRNAGIPHASGGDPASSSTWFQGRWYSPCEWG